MFEIISEHLDDPRKHGWNEMTINYKFNNFFFCLIYEIYICQHLTFLKVALNLLILKTFFSFF